MVYLNCINAIEGGEQMDKVKFSKFKARMAEKGCTYGNMAKVMGISAQSFSSKISGKTQFIHGEIARACEYLDADPIIFFD